MSNLVVSYDGLLAPPADCAQDPPVPTKQDPNPQDGCVVDLPLLDPAESSGAQHVLKFERKGKEFILSSKNASDELNWVAKRGNLAQMTDTLRLAENVMRLAKMPQTANGFEALLRISQFIITGKVRFDTDMSFYPEVEGVEGTEFQMATYLLEIVTNNSESSIQRLFGGITGFLGDAALSTAGKDRIRWATDILALRQSYIKFREHFSHRLQTGDEFAKLKNQDEKKNVAALLRFCRHLVIKHWQGKPFEYDPVFFQAFLAYTNLPDYKKAEKTEFCALVEKAMKELGAKLPEHFVQDCHHASKYMQMAPETAIRQSLRDGILKGDGHVELQRGISKESSASAMDIQWLNDRGRVGAMLDLILSNTAIKVPDKKGELPQLLLDVPAIKAALAVAVSKELVSKREYVLATLALLRRIMDERGSMRPVRIFHQNRYVEVSFSFAKGSREDWETLTNEYEKKLQISRKLSERTLPWAETALCVAGVGGVVVMETTNLSDNIYLGTSSAGLGGAGCGALVGHYLYPKIGKVRNRYLWEGVTGAGGLLIGAGIYLLAKSISASPGNPTKYPVDEYGP